jgi:DNA-binding response OmpR family regulator
VTLLDRVIGLEVGAENYIANPFHLREALQVSKAFCDAERLKSALSQCDERRVCLKHAQATGGGPRANPTETPIMRRDNPRELESLRRCSKRGDPASEG